MIRTLKIVLLANLVVLAVLTFVYPHLMVGPGKLIPGHRQLEADCFACHVPLNGASSERCANCHKPADIGRLTTVGRPIAKPLTSTPFHQQLVSRDCIACHSDHAGVKSFKQEGHFDHSLLKPETRQECQECHKSPSDSLHKQVSGKCTQCHRQDRWTPATFNHDKYFALDNDHNTRCVTCHVRNDYSRYTCYGCHEHSLANIRGAHIEEGIRDFDNCVKCHKSSREGGISDGEGGEND